MRFSGVLVVDGTGGEPFVGDVVIDGERIVDVQPADGSSDPNAQLALAPGFIDVHTHDDVQLLHTPDLAFKTLQGVTSVVVGNCGYSAAPQYEGAPMAPMFPSMGEFLAAIDAAPAAVNVAALVGHGSVRANVMGVDTDRAPTPGERATMADHVAEALDAGAIGMSTGLVYEPGRYSEADEVIELAALVAEAGGIYTTHMRNESEHLLDSIDESVAVAEATGVRLQISHLKASHEAAWGLVDDALDRIDAARARGVDVMFDQYPYTRGSTMFHQVANSGAFEGRPPFGPLAPERAMIASAPGHPEWEGRTLAELAADAGLDPTAMADHIVDECGPRCTVILDLMCEPDVRTVMAHPQMIVGSDGVYGGSRPHPRLHHTYPRVLGHYVRDVGLLALPIAVRAMTALAAERFGFADRGVIRPGAFADLVLFDPATIADTGTYLEPTAVPTGIAGVWVNGVRVVGDGVVTGERPGRLVRH
jgi:N-acyl-D-aspartate/D-glutamate deacylase